MDYLFPMLVAALVIVAAVYIFGPLMVGFGAAFVLFAIVAGIFAVLTGGGKKDEDDE